MQVKLLCAQQLESEKHPASLQDVGAHELTPVSAFTTAVQPWSIEMETRRFVTTAKKKKTCVSRRGNVSGTAG